MPKGSRNARRPYPGDERDRGVRALDPLVDAADRLEDLLGIELEAGDRRLQLVGEHVDEQFRVGTRVEVATVAVEELVGELARVGEVAVVDEHDAVGRVDVERLRLLLARRSALRRVPAVTETDRAQERTHVARAERLADLAPRLVEVEDAARLRVAMPRRVLSPVLEEEESVVDLLVDRACPTMPTMPHMRSRSLRPRTRRRDAPRRRRLPSLPRRTRRRARALPHEADRPRADSLGLQRRPGRVRDAGATIAKKPTPRFQVPSVSPERCPRGRRAPGTPVRATT